MFLKDEETNKQASTMRCSVWTQEVPVPGRWAAIGEGRVQQKGQTALEQECLDRRDSSWEEKMWTIGGNWK